MKELDVTEIWQRYEKGLDYLNRIDLPNKTRRCHRFYDGEQWYGMKSGGEELPSINFIKGIVKYKVTSVTQNNMTAVFSCTPDDNPKEDKACQVLGEYFLREWESAKLDTLCRQAIKDSAIQGDSYIYFGGGAELASAQLIDNVNVFFADEQESIIQEQKYIIIRERRFVDDIIKEAKENGISEDDICLITSDRDTYTQVGDGIEVDLEGKGKCISLLYMEKDEDGYVHVSRSVKSLVYQPDTILRCGLGDKKTGSGLKSYPLVNFLWEDRKGSARGVGEVEYIIPNQIEINKTVARRSIAIKQTAFPMIAYASNLIDNPDELDTIGGKIAINNGNAQSIDQIISYLRPASISPDAKNLSDELLQFTRDLSGASNSFTGNIDPTQASGTAIIAVRDQSQLPLNEQLTKYTQLVEDVARLFIDMWIAYNPKGILIDVDEIGDAGVRDASGVNAGVVNASGGIITSKGEAGYDGTADNSDNGGKGEVSYKGTTSIGTLGKGEDGNAGNARIGTAKKKERVTAQSLEKMKINIRVDVMKVSPFNLYATEQTLHDFYKSGAITFEEFVEALPEGGTLPKNKLVAILKQRQQEQSDSTLGEAGNMEAGLGQGAGSATNGLSQAMMGMGSSPMGSGNTASDKSMILSQLKASKKLMQEMLQNGEKS